MKNLKRFSAFLLAFVMAFAMSATAFAAVEDTGFSDVAADAWYAEAVMYCREHDLMAGIGNNQFAPEASLTRAQLATVLYRIEGTPAVTGTDAFTDTPDGAWYGNAVLWASQQALVSGYGGGLFGPNDPVSREQMTTIFWRYAGSPSADGAGSYNDEAEIASYAAAAVDWASANNIVAPVSTGVFAPKSDATRAHVAAALMNYSLSQQTQPTPNEGTKVLIAYFSATNNTESIANHLNAILDADLYEIVPETPYTSADLNYNDSSSRSQVELRDATARPAISGGVDGMEHYDVIFLGYPIWNGQAPKIISTFLERYDLSGKTIVPFCTSASSGIGSSATNLHTLAPEAEWLSGQRFSGSAAQSTVESWVDGLALPEQASPRPETVAALRVTASDGTHTVTFALNDSQASRALYDQLPLTVEIEDHSTNEKIFYPPEGLDTSDAPLASGGAGTLAYYAPWGDVVLFYDAFSGNGSLYQLGQAVEGGEWIETLSGTVTFQKSNGGSE